MTDQQRQPATTITIPSPRPAPAAPAADTDHDGQLRAAAAAGDQHAFAALYRQCRDTVFRYLMRRSNGDQHLAEDLTHDTFVRALARVDTYQDTGRPFVAWLLTIAGNLVADHYKSGWRRFQVNRGDFAREVDDGLHRLMWAEVREDLATTVAEDIDRRRTCAVLTRAMSELTDWQRRVLLLRFVEGLSVRDTALKLAVEAGAVKAATYRAMRTLAQHPLVTQLRGERMLADRRTGPPQRGRTRAADP